LFIKCKIPEFVKCFSKLFRQFIPEASLRGFLGGSLNWAIERIAAKKSSPEEDSDEEEGLLWSK
jgi:hypothetical protein